MTGACQEEGEKGETERSIIEVIIKKKRVIIKVLSKLLIIYIVGSFSVLFGYFLLVICSYYTCACRLEGAIWVPPQVFRRDEPMMRRGCRAMGLPDGGCKLFAR